MATDDLFAQDSQMWFLRTTLETGLATLHHIAGLIELDIDDRVSKHVAAVDPDRPLKGRSIRDIVVNSEAYAEDVLGGEHRRVVRTMAIAMAMTSCERSLVSIIDYCCDSKGIPTFKSSSSGWILETLRDFSVGSLDFDGACFAAREWQNLLQWWKVRNLIVHNAGFVPDGKAANVALCKQLKIDLEEVDDVRLGLRGHRIWPNAKHVRAAIAAAREAVHLVLQQALKYDPVQVVWNRDSKRYAEVQAGIRKEPAPFRPPRPPK